MLNIRAKLRNLSTFSRYFCPVCEKKVECWLPFTRDVGGGKYRLEPEGRLCPHCGSFERTRDFILYLHQTDALKAMPRFLHFAPERGLEHRLRTVLGDRYETIDLFAPEVDHRQDITAMTFGDCVFDFIYCSNVLEHVENDSLAMKELFRILRKGGKAYIQVPIKDGATYENILITTPDERTIHFGQADHVRYYGRDIIDRLTSTGFIVEEKYMPEPLGLTAVDIKRMNLGKKELVHLCVKPT